MYEELTADEATMLAVKHLNRDQEIPTGLMDVLEGLGIAQYFTQDAGDSDSEDSDAAGA